jgi:outer membrane biosynthesis protein TonB
MALMPIALFSPAPGQQVFQERAPPPVETRRPNDPAPQLIVLRPGAVECSGIAEEPVDRELPIPTAQQLFSAEPIRPITVAFSIDASGRPTDIREVPGARRQPWIDTSDAVPALAAWRFAPGAPRTRCTMTYTVNHLHAPDVRIEDAYRAFAFRRGNSPAMAPFYRLTIPAGSDCFHPFPAYRMRAYPPYDTLDQRPGTVSYAMVGYDVDRHGRTRRVRLLGGDRETPLARTALTAIRKTRFAPAAHHGCVLPFRLYPRVPLAAPPAPPVGQYRAADAECEGVPKGWASMPPLVFPPGFTRRSIEGWAIIRFDVAPWGATGDVSVAAAEPAAAFGETAKSIVARATKAPSKRGFSGCVEMVKFKMRPRRG